MQGSCPEPSTRSPHAPQLRQDSKKLLTRFLCPSSHLAWSIPETKGRCETRAGLEGSKGREQEQGCASSLTLFRDAKRIKEVIVASGALQP